MSDREKLMQLIGEIQNYGIDKSNISAVCKTSNETLADYLISNGVTVQKWIPVSERLPERTLPPRDVLVYHDLGCGMFVDRAWYSYDVGKWRSALGMKLKVTHWMPLPEPPKECE